MTASAPPGRLPWIDTARAIGIVLVVFGHALLSVERSGIPADPALIERTVKAIYAFHMPLFFLLAGITHRLVRRPSLGAGVVALGWTVVVPYFLWSSVWIGLKMLFPGAANTGAPVAPLDILWAPVDHFWFLYVLLIVRVAWLLADATGLASVRLAMIAGPLAVCLVGFPPASSIFSPWLFYWAAFYGLGVALGALPGTLGRDRTAAATALALAVFAAGAILMQVHGIVDVGLPRLVTALAGSAAVLGLAVLLPAGAGPVGRIVGFLGEASLAIFLTHTIVGGAVRLVLRQFDLLTAPVYVALATILGLALPAIAHYVVLRLGLSTGLPLARYAGFGTARTSVYLPLRRAADPQVQRIVAD